jgi:DNA-binding NtrC family response regulator
MISILIAEDDKNLLHLLKSVFVKKYYVETAQNGREIEAKAFENDFRVIILDLNMPHFVPEHFLKRLTSEKQDCKVIIISGSIDKSYAEDFRNVFGVLPKPFETSRLMKIVERALQN